MVGAALVAGLGVGVSDETLYWPLLVVGGGLVVVSGVGVSMTTIEEEEEGEEVGSG